MSIWTHVAAVIRVDAIRLPGMPSQIPALTARLKSGLPEGSEGPLDFTVRANPHPTHLAAFVVTIFGDLRDYDSAQEIIHWLHEVTRDQFVRQGVASICVEGQAPVDLAYVRESMEEQGRWERLR